MFSTSLNKEMHLFKRNYAINSYFTQKLLEKLGFPRKSNSEKRCILSSLSKHVFSGIYNQPKKKKMNNSAPLLLSTLEWSLWYNEERIPSLLGRWAVWFLFWFHFLLFWKIFWFLYSLEVQDIPHINLPQPDPQAILAITTVTLCKRSSAVSCKTPRRYLEFLQWSPQLFLCVFSEIFLDSRLIS